MRVRAGALCFAALCVLITWALAAQTLKPVASSTSGTERLTYNAEWRLVHAGTVVFETQKSHAELRIESAGMVSTLVKIHDIYTSDFEDGFCGTSSVMDSQEGKRHHEVKVTFDRARN